MYPLLDILSLRGQRLKKDLGDEGGGGRGREENKQLNMWLVTNCMKEIINQFKIEDKIKWKDMIGGKKRYKSK